MFAEGESFIIMVDEILSRDCNDFLDARDCSEGIELLQGCVKSLLRRTCQAFDQGQIPCTSLLDVMVSPFLKLAQRTSQLHLLAANSRGPDPPAVMSSLADYLGHWHLAALSVEPCLAGNGEVLRPVLMQPKQRSVFVKALVKTKFPEVRGRKRSGC